MTICAVSFPWKCCCAQSQWHLCCVLAQPVPNQWPWCGGTGGFGCSGTSCALKTVSLPGRGMLSICCLVFSGVFSVSHSTECVLTLSFLCLLSMHGLLRFLAPGTPNFAPEWAETVTFLFFKTMVPTLFQKRCLVSCWVLGFTLAGKGSRIDVSLHLTWAPSWELPCTCLQPAWHCMKTNTGVLWHAACSPSDSSLINHCGNEV